MRTNTVYVCERASVRRAPCVCVRLRAVACGCVRLRACVFFKQVPLKAALNKPTFRAASREPRAAYSLLWYIHAARRETHAARRTPQDARTHARNREPCARISGIRYLVASSSLSLSKSALRAALQHDSIRGATSASLFPCFLPFSLARSIARSIARSLAPSFPHFARDYK